MISEISKGVVLVQRQTLAWNQMDHDQFRRLSVPFCRMWGKADDFVYRLMRLWDETFSVNYFSIRQRVKEIALSNQMALPNVHFVSYNGYHNIPDGGRFYLFIDDDDWLAPDIGSRLLVKSLQHYDGLLWRIASIGSPNQTNAVLIWDLNGRCMTNNYAVSGHWLNGLSRLPEVIQHGPATKTLEAIEKRVQLDQVLSITNKSPCSSIFLANGLHGMFESPKLYELVAIYVEKMKAITADQLAEIRWAMDDIAETATLFEKVLSSYTGN